MHRQPLPAATLQHEGSPAGARERPAIRAGHLGQPSTRDPRAVARCVDVSARLEVKVANSRPAYVVAPGPGYVAYPAYAAALPGPNCYWTRMPVYDGFGNVVGWRGRPVAVCQ